LNAGYRELPNCRLKYCWLKVIWFICQSNELEREIKGKTGERNEGQPKIGERMAHPGPLTTATAYTRVG